MRILFVNERLDYSGVSSYSLDLARGLLGERDEIQVATRGGALRSAFTRVSIETYAVKLNYFSFRALLGFLREFDPELVHVQDLASVRLGTRLARSMERPWVLTVHGRPSRDGGPRLDDSLLGGVIAVNEVVREALVNDCGLPKSCIRLIPRGIDLSRLRPEPAREPPGAGAGASLPVVGSLGGLRREKGYHVLIDAASVLLARGVEAHFVIAGDGSEEKSLRRSVKSLGLEHHFTFAPNLPSLEKLYRLFDVVALPFLKEGVGVTVIEAMAMGKPVVASAVGEILNVLEDGVNGLLVPEGDAPALAEKLVTLLGDAELRARLGRQARAWVEERFALGPMVEATRSYYAEVLTAVEERRAASGLRGSAISRDRG